jgi:predicted MFS family arabinose efflux permease
MALTGSVFIFSSVAGPLLGGWFASTVGWRWAFWMNVPVAMLAITAAITLLHPAPAAARQRLAAIGLAPVPLRLLADREFVLATAGALCGAVAMFGTVGYLPTYLQMVDRLTPTAAGLHMVPVVLGIGTTAFTSGHIMSRTGRYAWMPVAGAVTVAAALAMLWSLRISTSPWFISAVAYLFGAGMGFGMQTLTIVAQNSFPAEVGTATASFAFFREIGAALGAAAVGGLFTARLTARLRGTVARAAGRRPLPDARAGHRAPGGPPRAHRRRVPRRAGPGLRRPGADDARGGTAAPVRA